MRSASRPAGTEKIALVITKASGKKNSCPSLAPRAFVPNRVTNGTAPPAPAQNSISASTYLLASEYWRKSLRYKSKLGLRVLTGSTYGLSTGSLTVKKVNAKVIIRIPTAKENTASSLLSHKNL